MYERTNSDGPACRACGKLTERIGTFSACADGHCERYAMPVNDHGLTDEEAAADAIAPLVPDEDATGYPATEEGFARYLRENSSHTDYGFARND